MRRPTPEQQAVLGNTSRVRIVHAVPGSGKTWLVAELIRQELNNWPTKTNGIAALSFTRVGGDEIRKAVGHDLGHPHYVGTIDAFLFRYVVRPFLQRCFPSYAAPRLIPGEWGAEHWGNYSRTQKAIVCAGINLFGCVFIDEENGKAVVAHKPHPAQPLRPLGEPNLNQVKTAKNQLWKGSGCLTHSDAALWATKILEHETLGAIVRAELLRRFPLIIVDELQDTGYFLGKSIRRLLDEPTARGVLVGDPDQAIYEFNGARPDLFDQFRSIEGSVVLPLSHSLRCACSVAAAASHLKDSGGSIRPAPRKTGRTFLVRYGNMVADSYRMLEALTTVQKSSVVKVIARRNLTVLALSGRSAEPCPKLGCRPLNHMHRAVSLFYQGRQVAALAAARAALDLVIFQHEMVEDTELQDGGIDPSRWKRLVVDCLLSSCAKGPIGNLYDWQTAVGKIVEEKLNDFDLDHSLQFTAGGLHPQKRRAWDRSLCGLPSSGWHLCNGAHRCAGHDCSWCQR
ncbi:MAG: UvrD-helicase domain-containing protein [Syntrophobacteraceae bacterium]